LNLAEFATRNLVDNEYLVDIYINITSYRIFDGINIDLAFRNKGEPHFFETRFTCDAAGRGFLDLRQRLNDFGNLRCRSLFSPSVDDVRYPARYAKHAILGDPPDIAGIKPILHVGRLTARTVFLDALDE